MILQKYCCRLAHWSGSEPHEYERPLARAMIQDSDVYENENMENVGSKFWNPWRIRKPKWSMSCFLDWKRNMNTKGAKNTIMNMIHNFRILFTSCRSGVDCDQLVAAYPDKKRRLRKCLGLSGRNYRLWIKLIRMGWKSETKEFRDPTRAFVTLAWRIKPGYFRDSPDKSLLLHDWCEL